MSLECHNEVLQEKEIDKDKEGELNRVNSLTFYGEYQNIHLTNEE